MKKLLTVLCGMSLALLIAANASALQMIVNGGFETNDFTGWDVDPDLLEAGWVINDGTDPPPLPDPYVYHNPISGNYDARVLPNYPWGTYWIRQTIIDIPIGSITSAILSWSDRIENYLPELVDPTHQFRVDLLGDTDAFEIFSTQSTQVGPNERIFDVTGYLDSLAGQSIKLSFQNTAKGPLSVTLDNISLEVEITPVPEPATILLLSTGLIGLASLGRKKRRC